MLRQLCLIAVLVACVSGHGRILEPPGRPSLWRFPEYAQYNPEPMGNDDEFWCGNTHQYDPPQACGVCGDPIDMARPRWNEEGGRFGRGIVVRTYSAGETIPIHFQSNSQNHGGFVKAQLCDRVPETEDCFRDLVLGNGMTRWPLVTAEGTLDVRTTAKLPDGVRCERCVLRMHYRGAQAWGTCDDTVTCVCNPNSGTPPGGMGCGPQQTFRNCADIKIQ